MDADLRPCPFCGGDATVKAKAVGAGGSGGTAWRVECTVCSASSYSGPPPPAFPDVVTAWNTRTPSPLIDSTDGERDSLRAVLVEAREELLRGDFSTGYCCCGSFVEGHGMGDGHSPVDEGQYHLQGVIERIDAALSRETRS